MPSQPPNSVARRACLPPRPKEPQKNGPRCERDHKEPERGERAVAFWGSYVDEHDHSWLTPPRAVRFATGECTCLSRDAADRRTLWPRPCHRRHAQPDGGARIRCRCGGSCFGNSASVRQRFLELAALSRLPGWTPECSIICREVICHVPNNKSRGPVENDTDDRRTALRRICRGGRNVLQPGRLGGKAGPTLLA